MLGMLLHRSDLRSLTFVICNLALVVWGLFLPIGIISCAFVPLLVLAAYITFNVNHNHSHLGVFRSPQLNIFFNVILTLCTGVPVSTIYYPHIVNHHPNVCNEKDWGGAHIAGNRKGLWRMIMYTVQAQMVQMNLRPRSLFTGLTKERQISLVCEILGLAIYFLFAVTFNWKTYLVHNILPWVLSSNLLFFMNFFLHDGCDPHSKWNHSKTFSSKFSNYFFLNGGYHLAHHEQPKLHWSELPKYHADKTQGKAPTHEHSSILIHFVKLYLG